MIIISADNVGTQRLFEPTTLRQLGLDENYLQSTLARHPQLLDTDGDFEDFGDLHVVQEVQLPSVRGTANRADLVVVTSRGHLLVVETKVFGNPDLQSRKPVAQVLDYASALVNCSNAELLAALYGSPKIGGWATFFRNVFDDLDSPALVAERFLRRLRRGEIHLFIACDRLPTSVYDWLDSVSLQSGLPFTLRVVELRPYAPQGEKWPITIAPVLRAVTKEIARTVVEVRQPEGELPLRVVVTPPSAATVSETASKPRSARNTNRPIAYMDLLEEIERQVTSALSASGSVDPPRWHYRRKSVPDGAVVEQIDATDKGHTVCLRLQPVSAEAGGGAYVTLFLERASGRSDRQDKMGRHEAKLRRIFETLQGPRPVLAPASNKWRGFASEHGIVAPDVVASDSFRAHLVADVALFCAAWRYLAGVE